jgi:cytochrome P450
MHHIHTGLPVIGPMLAFGRDPVQLAAQELVRSPVASFRLGTRQSYLISGADYAYEALVGQGAKFFKDTLSKKAGSNFVGNGLVLSDGNVHRQQRRRMTPAFYHSRINAYVEIAHRHTLQRA